jgi:hypothetical protein
MQQATRRLVILLGGTFLAAGGLILAACSTDNGGAGSSGLPTAEAGKTDTGSSGSSGSSGTDGSTDAGTDPDCAFAPKLRNDTNGFYCPFVPQDAGKDASDGGNPSYCLNDQVCCNGGRDPSDTTKFGSSFCAPALGGNKSAPNALNASCDNWGGAKWFPDGGTMWGCTSAVGCGGTGACCFFKRPSATSNVNVGKNLDTDIPAACDAKQVFQHGGTYCAPSGCAAGEIKLCSLNSQDCGAGSTCKPVEGSARDLGYCD